MAGIESLHLHREQPIRRTLGTGADYGLGTIGTCLGPLPSGGPPSDQKKIPMTTVKKRKTK